ncbi:MAG: SDR family oxidoreductase [Deltaproteobacteria bacterium]|nr:SDR family oxidoreductase [Deltaproteobacteria bacterium]
MVDFSLKGKVALVTGASRGIGESIALNLSQYGAKVILVSRKEDALKEVAEKVKAQGGEALVMACHTGNLDQVEVLVKRIEAEVGRLDILVNNAATNPHFGEMLTAPESAWDKTFEVNVKGPFFLIQKIVPLMEKNGGGAIVNVSSVNGVRPAYYQGVYSITKAAIISMTRAWAKELAPRGIRVNALLPGLTKTSFAKALFDNPDVYGFAVKEIPMGRHAVPEEMAGAVLYLVSSASSYTTGTSITCDGGMLA